MTESLAAGTPVVGSNSGALPEIISDPSIGTLFERTDDVEESARNLADAVLRSLELAREPDIAERCRAHARHWTWESLGARFDQLQKSALVEPRLSLAGAR
jgi:glycosyltransferase involved in cell wall biosynthesis